MQFGVLLQVLFWEPVWGCLRFSRPGAAHCYEISGSAVRDDGAGIDSRVLGGMHVGVLMQVFWGAGKFLSGVYAGV